jgi:Rieske Fe-S protein
MASQRSLTRRAVLAGACGTCAVALTGCGAAVTGTAAPTAEPAAAPPVEPVPSAAAEPKVAALASTADIPVGGGTILTAQKLVVTQPEKGTYKAFSAVCTHQGCAVTTVKNGVINCACHDSNFDIADGSVVSGPARKALPAKKIKVSGSSITLA